MPTFSIGIRQAIDPLNRPNRRPGDLGDYVAYYLGTSSLQTDAPPKPCSSDEFFPTVYPESLLSRDAQVTTAARSCWKDVR